jgi:hypothetical protein
MSNEKDKKKFKPLETNSIHTLEWVCMLFLQFVTGKDFPFFSSHL